MKCKMFNNTIDIVSAFSNNVQFAYIVFMLLCVCVMLQCVAVSPRMVLRCDIFYRTGVTSHKVPQAMDLG